MPVVMLMGFEPHTGALSFLSVGDTQEVEDYGFVAGLFNVGFSFAAATGAITAAGVASSLSVGLGTYGVTDYLIQNTYLDGQLGVDIADRYFESRPTREDCATPDASAAPAVH